MSYTLRLAQLSKQERVAVAADKLDLTACLKRTPKELSSGQRQRAAIGRAITQVPKMFLFDEP